MSGIVQGLKAGKVFRPAALLDIAHSPAWDALAFRRAGRVGELDDHLNDFHPRTLWATASFAAVRRSIKSREENGSAARLKSIKYILNFRE
jgi:hypothetical protein